MQEITVVLSVPVRSRRGVPGGERGGVRRVDGGVAGGVVALGAGGGAGAARHGRHARPQAGAARHRPLPGRRAPALRHDRGESQRHLLVVYFPIPLFAIPPNFKALNYSVLGGDWWCKK